MLRIIISGCNGHMGRVVESLCNADPEVQVAAGFDVLGSADREFPVCSSPAQFTGEADAVIDFSSPAALRRHVQDTYILLRALSRGNVFRLTRAKSAPPRRRGARAYMEPMSETITLPTASANWLMWRILTSSRP